MISNPKQSSIMANVIARGKQVYNDRLKGIVEPDHVGKYIVIDVETGEYEIDVSHLAATNRAMARMPDALLYGARIGFPTLGRIGKARELVLG